MQILTYTALKCLEIRISKGQYEPVWTWWWGLTVGFPSSEGEDQRGQVITWDTAFFVLFPSYGTPIFDWSIWYQLNLFLEAKLNLLLIRKMFNAFVIILIGPFCFCYLIYCCFYSCCLILISFFMYLNVTVICILLLLILHDLEVCLKQNINA